METQKVKINNKINKQKEIEQKKRKKRKRAVITILIITTLTIVGIYLFTSPTFKIKTITVTGNNILTDEKVLDIADIKIGDNIFSKIGIILKVKLKQNGAIEDVKINKLYPNRVEIEITERTAQFQIKTENEKYINIDNQGYILGTSEKKAELMTIVGMEMKETDVNTTKRLNEKDLNKMENILQICKKFKDLEINEEISQIDVQDEYIIILNNNEITINIGDATNLTDRMYYVKALLKQEAGNKGTIYINGNLNDGFLPYFSAN